MTAPRACRVRGCTDIVTRLVPMRGLFVFGDPTEIAAARAKLDLLRATWRGAA